LRSRDISPHDFQRRARTLRWLLTDVDGVLTDGRMLYGTDGEAFKIFQVRDGLALKMARQDGIHVGLLSARSHPAVTVRAEELGVDRVMLGEKDKLARLKTFLEEEDVRLEQIAYIGDDLPDLAVLGAVGLAFCPADAALEVRHLCHITLNLRGGHGAVREAVETLLKARGSWERLVGQFVGS
jgi:3-deoxy-D-manno-octulosonate 8-phosphate phosphatase (KDO 8-P phosphatase)